jgi:hypothetical protein
MSAYTQICRQYIDILGGKWGGRNETKEGEAIMVLWFSILFFNIADWALTYYAITERGALELKPPLTWLIDRFGVKNGLATMLVIKVALQFAVLPLDRWAWWVILVVMALVCAWNGYQIFKASA